MFLFFFIKFIFYKKRHGPEALVIFLKIFFIFAFFENYFQFLKKCKIFFISKLFFFMFFKTNKSALSVLFWKLKIELDSNRGFSKVKSALGAIFFLFALCFDFSGVSTVHVLRGGSWKCACRVSRVRTCAHATHATPARHGRTHRRAHSGFCGFLRIERARTGWELGRESPVLRRMSCGHPLESGLESAFRRAARDLAKKYFGRNFKKCKKWFLRFFFAKYFFWKKFFWKYFCAKKIIFEIYFSQKIFLKNCKKRDRRLRSAKEGRKIFLKFIFAREKYFLRKIIFKK